MPYSVTDVLIRHALFHGAFSAHKDTLFFQMSMDMKEKAPLFLHKGALFNI